jgi:hypothetical protein
MRFRLLKLRSKYTVPVLAALILLFSVSIATGITVVTEAEKQNTFCASCHTEPETTYLHRFAAALNSNAPDLASYHHAVTESSLSPKLPNMRCVDCHQGEGVAGRSIILTLAAYDSLKHFTRTAKQPATISFNIQNEACLKCHEPDARKYADQPEKPFIIDNHYHYKYFQTGAPQLQCVACHLSHVEGTHLNKFQFRRVTIPICEACHRFQGRGPVKMQ